MQAFAWLSLLGLAFYVRTGAAAAPQHSDDGFLDLLREPNAVSVTMETGSIPLVREGTKWRAEGIEVTARPRGSRLPITLSAPGAPVKYVTLRWDGSPPAGWKYLGDAWERAYGNLEWRSLDKLSEMPWYFLATDGQHTHGYGVMTGPSAMCAWALDRAGVTLTADVRCGGAGVRLGSRRLTACVVVSRRGRDGETPFAAAQAFCRVMCPKPVLPPQRVYGFNDWYCDYGRNSAESVLYYAAFIARLSPKGDNRPFMVVDDGWQEGGGGGRGGPWDHGNARFPSMEDLARGIRKAGARPGIWTRLLLAQTGQPESWRLPGRPDVLDPSRPEVRAYIKETVARMRAWGYDLIKHDYSTFDISQGWGVSAGAAPDATWAFWDRSRTTAEILRDHYLSIREGAGGALLIGCNTVSHLAAGIFPIQRIGDDTSGREWARTLKMGVNSLAFRGPQHNTFYAADADCVGLTQAGAIPWALDRQWMDLLAQSGTPFFVSFKKGSVTEEQEKDIAAALALAAEPQPTAEPMDWLDTLQPRRWKLGEEVVEYNWSEN